MLKFMVMSLFENNIFGIHLVVFGSVWILLLLLLILTVWVGEFFEGEGISNSCVNISLKNSFSCSGLNCNNSLIAPMLSSALLLLFPFRLISTSCWFCTLCILATFGDITSAFDNASDILRFLPSEVLEYDFIVCSLLCELTDIISRASKPSEFKTEMHVALTEWLVYLIDRLAWVLKVDINSPKGFLPSPLLWIPGVYHILSSM